MSGALRAGLSYRGGMRTDGGRHPHSTRLLLVRHAEHDSHGRFTQHACRGLTGAGVEQARRLARALAAAAPVGGVVVLSSRAARASQTAEIVADALGLPVRERTCDLCEMHPGDAEGLTQSEMEARFGPSYASVPGAEHFPDWLPSAVSALRGVGERYHGHWIVAVTRFAVVRASFCAFAHQSEAEIRDLRPSNTGITEWVSEDGGVWGLERYDDVRHLSPPHAIGVA